jgi:RHH-type proline utilization regulon transcriptional repressor/proline dehydrogenase/delta 1-pyrroline-5-carboxylate dehydrogenase
LGIVACISPWNFPLAIFAGQVSAALAAGNVVIAKPAEQTPLMAHRVVSLLHEAGIPLQALQLLTGAGESMGASLVADHRVAGVVFTGSTLVAQHINRSLLLRAASLPQEPVLIAETGGQNAMIVDSTALPEQVAQDVLTSAFDSAGQRCSALRVLCLQSDSAESVLGKLRGAMLQIRIGDPCHAKTDIGPVIDGDARQSLMAYVESFRKRSRVLMECPLPVELSDGSFVAPTVLEIDSLDELRGEIFGPVLHVLRYDAQRLPQLVEAINDLGFGLTMGLHSRIDARAALLTERARIGNLYINRNMIGAVVGVQPFGGEGKSGTGPKAGGPLYLLRLQRHDAVEVRPRIVRQDAGGEAALEPGGEVRGKERDEALQALASFGTWCRERTMLPLAALCSRYANDTLLGTILTLPGPTGERNTLQFKARGVLRCRARQLPNLLHQIAAIVATGNLALLDRDTERLLPCDLPPSVTARILLPDTQGHNGTNVQPCQLTLFEAGEGVPFADTPFDAEPDDRYAVMQCIPVGQQPIALWRLVAERAVCINTAAAGGNASLMASST